MKSLIVTSILLTVPAVALGCTQASPQPAAQPVVQAIDYPDTVGSEVWEFLLGEKYTENWELWPGKGEKYEGVEPHGMLLTTYLNRIALDALEARAGSMPNNSIIVKENYTPDGTLDATTVMYKVAGYDPEHNDWFWTKVRSDGSIEAEGKVDGCQSCHRARRANDYVYTGSLSE